MKISISQGTARQELLSAARKSDPGDELKCHALMELMDTSCVLEESLKRELAHSELTSCGFHLLAHLIHHEPRAITPGEIATEFKMPRQMVSSILGRLEVSGLISRSRMPGNRRNVMLQATPKGHDAFANALNHCLESITQYMSVLNDDEITRLDQSSGRLRQATHSFSN